LVVVLLSIFNKQTSNFFYKIFSPVQKISWAIGNNFSCFTENVFRIETIQEERNFLRYQNARLLNRINENNFLIQENKLLREALELKEKDNLEFILATIVSKDISTDYIVVDQGGRHGVQEGQAVITGSKTLIGEISEVFPDFSRVQLITCDNTAFDIEINNKLGLAKGSGNQLYIDLLKEEPQTGSLIITSSLGGVFPPGLLIGQVFSSNEVEGVWQAKVRIPLTVRDLKQVLIIK